MPGIERSALARFRVLLIDGDPYERGLTGVLLRAHGAEVIAVGSPEDAMQLLASQRFDALLAEIGMPPGNGYELIRAIRALPPDSGGRIPAVAITALASSGEGDQALAAGFDWHVQKPVDAITLVDVIAGVMLGRRMRPKS